MHEPRRNDSLWRTNPSNVCKTWQVRRRSLKTQMADLNRDYAVLKQKYDELRVRAESARISRDARTDTAVLAVSDC